MNLKQLKLTTREFGLLMIAIGALAFAWMGTANAGGPDGSSRMVMNAEADGEMFFDDDGEFAEGDEWLEEEDMMFDAVAKALNMDIEALFTELDSGKSIADVANANDVDPQTIVDLLIAEENKFIDELLTAGEITEAEAEEWKAESAKYTPFMVNSVYTDPDVIAAQLIGIDVEALRTEVYDNGSTIKAVAEANNVDPQAIIDAIVASENAAVDEMLAAELITEAEAAEWKAENSEFATSIVNESWDDFGCDEMHGDFDDDEMGDEADADNADA